MRSITIKTLILCLKESRFFQAFLLNGKKFYRCNKKELQYIEKHDKIIKNKRGYFNLNNSSDEHMGMGLIISEILATKHGGSVELSNVKDGGAKVIVKIALTVS